MFNFFLPNAYFRSLADINFHNLYSQGYRLVLLDMDNTLIKHGSNKRSPFSDLQIARMENAGLRCVILSNGVEKRVKKFASAYNIDYVAMAGKPSKNAVIRACKQFDFALNQVILIGDQIFTDVFCGRRSGVWTILVAPLDEREKWYIKLKRIIEIPLKKSIKMTKKLRIKNSKHKKLWKLNKQKQKQKNNLVSGKKIRSRIPFRIALLFGKRINN